MATNNNTLATTYDLYPTIGWWNLSYVQPAIMYCHRSMQNGEQV